MLTTLKSPTPTPIVELNAIRLSIPIYGHETRSLKKTLVGIGTGGHIASDAVTGLVQVEALKGISFQAFDGDRIGIVGTNGAGKSSLLRLIAGIYDPTAGEVIVRGSTAPLLDVGLGIDDDATGLENIAIRGALLGISKARLTAMQPDIIEFTELGDYINLPVRTYSSGMKMRLSLAISVCIEPDVLLLDEWISTGDARFLRKAEARLLSLISKLKVLFFASHALDILQNTCNKLLVLNNGEMLFFGPMDEGLGFYRKMTSGA